MSGTGSVFDVDRQSLYLGGGADVRGAGPVNIPALQLVGHLGDAIYVPRLANQKLESSRFDATATRNNILLEVAQTYLALLGAEASLLAYRQSESEVGEVARLAADFAAKGQGRDSDARRARAELLLLRGAAQRAEEDIALGTIELSRLLNLDPSVRLRPEPGTPPLIQLVDDKLPLEALVQMALAGRPEIVARSFDVAFNETRLQQERVRPLLPTISIGVSAGDFGGGSNLVPYRFSHFSGRTDVDVLAVWTLQNFGLGNRALQNRARAQIGEAEAVRLRVINLVRQEVAEALAQTQVKRRQMEIAQRRVETASKAYRQDLERARNLKGNMIEVLNSLNLLTAARQDLIAEMIRYSQAQFQLHVALGATPGSNPARP
jgi:outer membrane protein TolC